MQVRHYTQLRHEVIELAKWLDFTWGNVVKYLLRAPFKGDTIGDLRKAIDYIKFAQGATGVESWIKLNAVTHPIFDDFIEDLYTVGEYTLSFALYFCSVGKAEVAAKMLEDHVNLLELESRDATKIETD